MRQRIRFAVMGGLPLGTCTLCALLLSACAEPPQAALRNDAGGAGRTATQDVADARDNQVADAALDAMLGPDAGFDAGLDASLQGASDAVSESAPSFPRADAAPSEATRSSLTLPNRWQLLDAGADPF